jgi:ABC-2 type transport system ATP-binding protein
MSIIKTEHLSKFYGKARGVADLSLKIEKGECFGFIGPNGAGKSTTIRMLMQLIFPTSGNFWLFEQIIKGENPALRRRIGYIPSEINYYQELTGRQLLELGAKLYEVGTENIAPYAELLELDLSKTVKSYSLGNRKKLGIIQSLLHDPELLILDEPTSGLDPLIQHRFFQLLKEKNRQGLTIFLSTHVLSEIEKFCHRVGLIRAGKLINLSSVEDLPGRAERIVEVTYSEEGDLRKPYGLSQIDPAVRYQDGRHIFHVKEHLHKALAIIAQHPIADIIIKQPTLEELFMKYYGQREEE